MRSGPVNVGGRMVPPSEAGTAASKEADRIYFGGGGGGGGGGGNECFPAGTMIQTPAGECDIADLSPGDLVCAVDITNMTTFARPIMSKVSHGITDLWALRLDNGTLLRTTRVHSFYSGNGWKKASSFTTGDTISVMNADGVIEARKVLESEALRESEKVFNLIVEENFTFIANGVTAHSFTYFRKAREYLWRVKKLLSNQPKRDLKTA